ncbi:MAG TPA: hypothetical protein VFL95_10450 [Gemmatimonadales bacterium]|nr:hypothetical protein [Gemmatimonadales bacterium]
MAHYSQLRVVTLGAACVALLVLGCDNPETPPIEPDQGSVAVQGVVSEEGQPPDPRLPVTIQAWGALQTGGTDSVRMETDSAGEYVAQLGPFSGSMVDSVRVRVTQSDCGRETITDLRRENVALSSGEPLVLPDVTLSYRLPEAQFGSGAAMCGSIRVPSTQGVDGEYVRLALWIDQVTDSVRGRWRLNYSTSVGDEYGYFAGVETDAGLTLELTPQPESSCGTIDLAVPFAEENSATLGVGELASAGACVLPGSVVRFFEGAELGELVPAVE